MSNIYRIVFCIVFLFVSGLVFAESEGGALFRQNMPAEAIPVLERDIAAGKALPEDYNYLGLAYYQTGDWEKSVAAFEAGFLVSGTNKRILAYNAGNTCFGAGEYEKAEEYYSLALIADSSFKEAMLNRANARFWQDNLAGAVEDYELFVNTALDDENAPMILEMIALLKAEIKKREENARMEEELERRRREEDAIRNRELVEDAAPEDGEQDGSQIAEEASSEKVSDDIPDVLLPDTQDAPQEMVQDEVPDEPDDSTEEETRQDEGDVAVPQEMIQDEVPDEMEIEETSAPQEMVQDEMPDEPEDLIEEETQPAEEETSAPQEMIQDEMPDEPEDSIEGETRPAEEETSAPQEMIQDEMPDETEDSIEGETQPAEEGTSAPQEMVQDEMPDDPEDLIKGETQPAEEENLRDEDSKIAEDDVLREPQKPSESVIRGAPGKNTFPEKIEDEMMLLPRFYYEINRFDRSYLNVPAERLEMDELD